MQDLYQKHLIGNTTIYIQRYRNKFAKVEYLLTSKGISIYANEPIKRGTLIMSEAYAIKQGNTIFNIQIKEGTKHMLGTLCGSENILIMLQRNAITLGRHSTSSGVFVEVSRFNHSCCSNCVHFYNNNENLEYVYAAKDIEKGEELTINYLDNKMFTTYQQRKNVLMLYDFVCDCEMCNY